CGIDPRFRPDGTSRSPTPLVVAVGRLVPVKRYRALIDVLVAAKQQVPDLTAVIAGEGYERDALRVQIAEHAAGDWIDLPGRIGDEAVVDLYRRAWVVASTSAREGWGMSIAEAAACGTPAVASRVVGHLDSVVDGQSGFLADTDDELAAVLVRVL